MHSFTKKIVAFVIILSTILSLGLFNFTLAFADDGYDISITSKGSTFSKQTYFQTTKGLSALPNTFETVISLPKNFGTGRAGVIFSNYNHSSNAAISVELYSGGYPRLYYKADGDTTVDIVFNNTSVLDYNGYFHLAITHDDANKTAKCYINGVLKQTLTYAKTYQEAGVSLQTLPFGSGAGSLGEFRVGNDFRHDNAQFFKGNIKTIAVYSNVKTSFDVNKIAISNDLIVAYDLSDISNLGKDLSKNANDAIFRGSP